MRRPSVSTRTCTPFPYTTLFRSSVGHPPGLLAPVGVALVLVHRHRRSSPLKGNMRSDPIHNSSHYCVNDKSPPGPHRHADSALPGPAGRDNRRQLPAISSVDSASTLIDCTIAPLTESPLATPPSRPTHAVPLRAQETGRGRERVRG